MQDSNARRPEESDSGSDATSKETLEDLEKSEQNTDADDAADESQLPSPDGVNDETPNKPNDVGPM